MFATPKGTRPRDPQKKKDQGRDAQYYDFVRKTLKGKIEELDPHANPNELTLRMDSPVKFSLEARRDGYHIVPIKSSSVGNKSSSHSNENSNRQNNNSEPNSQALQVQFNKTYDEIRKLKEVIGGLTNNTNEDNSGDNMNTYVQNGIDQLIQELNNIKLDTQRYYSPVSARVELDSNVSFSNLHRNTFHTQDSDQN